jgi:hypothetical protein
MSAQEIRAGKVRHAPLACVALAVTDRLVVKTMPAEMFSAREGFGAAGVCAGVFLHLRFHSQRTNRVFLACFDGDSV